MKIDGIKIANEILENLRLKVAELKKKNIYPKLAIIAVGNDPASIAYIKQKELKAKSIGIKTATYKLESDIQNPELIKLIKRLNNDKAVHGVIVQQPLPAQINLEEVIEAIDPQKDVDGFNPNSKFEMPLAMAVIKILEEINPNQDVLKSKNIAIIGKGETGGMPIIKTFKKLGLSPIIIDSKTQNPESITKKADVIISAVGKSNVIKPEMVKKGAVLIGVGISEGESAKLVGDYDQNRIENLASFYTPTPGGVGPVNVAMLLKNLINAADNNPSS